MAVEVPPATDLVSGVLPSLHQHQSGLTFTLGGVEHAFGLYLACEDLVSWSVRPKLCQMCPLCIANNFPRHMDWRASCGGARGLYPELDGACTQGKTEQEFHHAETSLPFHSMTLYFLCSWEL